MTSAKRVVIIPDGFADDPVPALGGRTPMQAARTPNIDAWAPRAAQGRSFNVPETLTPGSDVATLSLLGYDPLTSYTGRAPLEAAAQGIELGPKDWAFRCNLVCIEDGIMKDFTAGHISTEEATQILTDLQRDVAAYWEEFAYSLGGTLELVPGVSYRNLAIFRPEYGWPYPFNETTLTVPPHDYTDQHIDHVLPDGPGTFEIRTLMDKCAEYLKTQPTNLARIARGETPVTDCWFWGQGKRPELAPFAEAYEWGAGAMITAVDLLRGIARNIGWDVVNVPGATGYVDTDFAAKGEYAAKALDDYDIVVVHVEAPDESGHEGSTEKKIFSLEQIDEKTLPPILEKLQSFENWRLLISPDHPTPVAIKTHSRGFVPWMIVGSDVSGDGFETYDETTGARASRFFPEGRDLMTLFLRGNLQ